MVWQEKKMKEPDLYVGGNISEETEPKSRINVDRS